MNYADCDLYTLELPSGHRFPMEKYRQTRLRLLEEGTVKPEQLHDPGLCPLATIEAVHTPDYLGRVLEGHLTREDERRLGFPWSEALVRRSRASTAGTLLAARFALADGSGGNFAGGTHHAYPDRGEGFCIFNDVAVAARQLQSEGSVKRVAVVDCDVHQGNGTAFIFRKDPAVFTLSLHGRNNWPFEKEASTLDVAFDDGTGDEEYLSALDTALDEVFAFVPNLLFYVAGVDPLRGDRLGRLALSHEGLRMRDELVYSRASSLGVPIATCFGGGYATDLDAIVEAHANTFRTAESVFGGR